MSTTPHARAGHPIGLGARNPWPGLRSFTEDDQPFFFGREKETATLLGMVERNPVVVLYGQSGLGKTSLLRAGLFPRLKAGDRVPVWVRLDQGDASPPLAGQILTALQDTFARIGVEAPPPREGESIWSYFHRQDVEFWGARNRLVEPVIVLDQFEELFTLGQRSPSAQARVEVLLRELEAQFEQRPPADVRDRLDQHPEDAAEYDLVRENVHFVVSLREDYLPHLDALRGRLPSMLAQRFRLEQMDTSQALDVVLRAGAEVIEPEVARDVVAFVAGQDGRDAVTHVAGRVEPAILSVVCDELNLRRERAGMARITQELLSGERARIVADFYERSFEGIAEPVRDWVEDELLTASGHRDRAAVEDARRLGLDTDAIQQLVERRVLHSDERQNVVWVELTHDLLTEPALASRNARQARRLEAEAADRTRAAAEQLRRSRRLTAVFAVLFGLMSLGALYMYRAKKATDEARAALVASEEKASRSAQLAQDQAVAARRAESEARTEAQRADDASRQAQVEAARAGEAEVRVTDSLTLARATAVTLARQGAEALEREWAQPGYGAAEVVRAAIRQLDTLTESFSDVPELRSLRVRSLALAALIQHERLDESACTAHVAKAQAADGQAPGGDAGAAEARALLQLARGQCQHLRGEFDQASRMHLLALEAARRLPEASRTRHRVTLAATLGQASAKAARYEHVAARGELDALQQRTEQARRHLPGGELTAWEAANLQVRSDLRDAETRPVEELRRHEALMARLTSAEREQPAWRFRAAERDLRLSYAFWNRGQLPQAEDALERSTQSLDVLLAASADPPLSWQLWRLSARRLEAELAVALKQSARAKSLFDKAGVDAKALSERAPGLVRMRYQLAVAQWLVSQNPEVAAEGRQQSLATAERTLTDLVATAPRYAEAIRSLAVVQRDRGKQAVTQHQATKPKEGAGSVQLDEAETHYARAIATMQRLAHATDLALVSDMVGGIEELRAEAANLRNDAAARRAAYERAALEYRKVPITGANRLQRTLTATYPSLFVARLMRESGEVDAARTVEAESLNLISEARRDAPKDAELLDRLGWLHFMAAGDHIRRGNFSEAVRSHSASMDGLIDAVRENPLNKAVQKSFDDANKWRRDTLRAWLEQVRDGKRQAAPGTDAAALLQEVERIDKRTLDTRRISVVPMRGWSLVPAFPGEWNTLDLAELRRLEPRLEAALAALTKEGWNPLGARRAVLPFYRDTAVVEVLVRRADGEEGAAAYLVGPGVDPMRFNGLRTVVYDFNRSNELDLRQERYAVQYLRLVVSSWQYDDGMWRIIEDPRDLLWEPGTTDAVRASVLARLEPLRFQRNADGGWSVAASVQSGTNIYSAKFDMQRDGTVELFRDDGAASQAYLASEQYAGGVRVRRKASALRLALAELRKGKDWKALARTEEQLITDLARPLRTAADKKRVLPGPYLSLGWYRLFARDFDGALKASQAGLEIDPDNLPLQTNRANALLFLGRDAEALAIYREHVGKPVPTSDGKLWQFVVGDDFDQFEREGLTHPRMAEIRALIGAPAAPARAASAAAAASAASAAK